MENIIKSLIVSNYTGAPLVYKKKIDYYVQKKEFTNVIFKRFEEYVSKREGIEYYVRLLLSVIDFYPYGGQNKFCNMFKSVVNRFKMDTLPVFDLDKFIMDIMMDEVRVLSVMAEQMKKDKINGKDLPDKFFRSCNHRNSLEKLRKGIMQQIEAYEYLCKLEMSVEGRMSSIALYIIEFLFGKELYDHHTRNVFIWSRGNRLVIYKKKEKEKSVMCKLALHYASSEEEDVEEEELVIVESDSDDEVLDLSWVRKRKLRRMRALPPKKRFKYV